MKKLRAALLLFFLCIAPGRSIGFAGDESEMIMTRLVFEGLEKTNAAWLRDYLGIHLPMRATPEPSKSPETRKALL